MFRKPFSLFFATVLAESEGRLSCGEVSPYLIAEVTLFLVRPRIVEAVRVRVLLAFFREALCPLP